MWLAGSKTAVVTAVKAGKHRALQRVLEAMLGCQQVEKLIYATFGNYTLQDLLHAAKRLREAADVLLEEGRLTAAQAAKAVGTVNGADYLGTAPLQLHHCVCSVDIRAHPVAPLTSQLLSCRQAGEGGGAPCAQGDHGPAGQGGVRVCQSVGAGRCGRSRHDMQADLRTCSPVRRR